MVGLINITKDNDMASLYETQVCGSDAIPALIISISWVN